MSILKRELLKNGLKVEKSMVQLAPNCKFCLNKDVMTYLQLR